LTSKNVKKKKGENNTIEPNTNVNKRGRDPKRGFFFQRAGKKGKKKGVFTRSPPPIAGKEKKKRGGGRGAPNPNLKPFRMPKQRKEWERQMEPQNLDRFFWQEGRGGKKRNPAYERFFFDAFGKKEGRGVRGK